MALEFDSAQSEYVLLPNHADLKPTAAITWAFWLRYNDNPGMTFSYLIDYSQAGAIQDGYRIVIPENGLGSDHFLRWLVGRGAASYSTDADYFAYYSATVWHHIVCTYDKTDELHIYVDGAAFAASGTGGDDIDYTDAANQPTVGWHSPRTNANYYMHGALADIRLYNRALSLTEAEILFASQGADTIVNGLQARWKLDEGAGGAAAAGASSIRDCSINRHDGTPTNTPTYRDAPMRVMRPMR